MNRHRLKFKWCYPCSVCPCEVRTTIRVSVPMQKHLPLHLISLPYMTYSFKPLIKPCRLVFYSLEWMQKLIKIPSGRTAVSHYVMLIYIWAGQWCVWGSGDCVTSFQQVVIIFQPSGFNSVWLAQSRMGFRTPWPFLVDTSRKTNDTHLLLCQFTADRDVLAQGNPNLLLACPSGHAV